MPTQKDNISKKGNGGRRDREAGYSLLLRRPGELVAAKRNAFAGLATARSSKGGQRSLINRALLCCCPFLPWKLCLVLHSIRYTISYEMEKRKKRNARGKTHSTPTIKTHQQTEKLVKKKKGSRGRGVVRGSSSVM